MEEVRRGHVIYEVARPKAELSVGVGE